MRERRPRIREIKKRDGKKTASSVLFMGLSLFLTIALFIGLVIAQSFLLEDITYKEIVIAKTDIPRNVIITENNIETYFTKKAVNILDVTAGAMELPTELIGQKAVVMIHAGEPVAAKDFEKLSKYIEGFEEPVEISIQIPDIASADGGKLRAGDLINLTMMFTNEQLGNEELTETTNPFQNDNGLLTEGNGLLEDGYTEELNEEKAEEGFSTSTSQYRYETWAQYVMENLYVYKTLDSSGIEIDPTDTEALADILIFIIEKDTEADLNNALANCAAMRISKVYEKPSIAYVDISVVGENGEVLSEEHVQTEVTPEPAATAAPTPTPEPIATEVPAETVQSTATPDTVTEDIDEGNTTEGLIEDADDDFKTDVGENN